MSESNVPFPYRIVFLTGVDGSGKTFFARKLIEELDSRGFKAIHVWSRFNNYVSKPLLGIARLIGLNYYEQKNGVKVGYHDFERSRVTSFLFIWLQLIDVWIASIIKFWLPLIKGGVMIVADRGPHDTLIDVAIDTGRNNLPVGIIGRLYRKAIPFRHKILFIEREVKKIESSRPDVKSDRKFRRRCDLYARHAQTLGFHIVPNNGTVDETMTNIFTKFFDEEKKTARLDI